MQRYLIFVLLLTASCQLHKVHKSTESAQYPNGKTQWTREIKTIENARKEIDNNYKRTITTYNQYSETGVLQMRYKIVQDAGADNPCHETLFELDEYHPNGKIARKYRMECDCHKEDEKTYNEKGQLLTHKTSFIKRLY